jgi:chromosome partitioning protein
MNVIVVASRKGGSGKSTLTAHLAAQASKPSRPMLLIDADPQGSLTLWHELRGGGEPKLKRGARGIGDAVRAAKQDGYAWTFIDTPPTRSSQVVEIIRLATLVVIPARPSIFDLEAVKDTIEMCRDARKPYAVVINGAPPKRGEAEAAIVTEAREGLQALKVPVWAGQITNRADFSLALGTGQGAKEFDAASAAAAELGQLWTAIDRSVKAINGAVQNARVMHRAAA